MVEGMESLKAFLQREEYCGLAENIVRRTRKKLCADLYDAEVAYCQNVLGAAGLSLSDLGALLAGDTEILGQFCIRLIGADARLNVGQDFNLRESEELEEENEVYVGHSKTFLFTFCVLYLILRDRRSALPAYLKAIRQPKAIKYQRSVELLFDGLRVQ